MPIGFTGNFQVVGYRGGKGHPTLAMRPFADSTWATLTASMYVGQTHRAIIKRFTDDGAAVVYLTSKIQARVEYKKELDTLSEGDEVNVRLTFIDSMRQRIGVVLEDTTHAAP
jgi:ribosomal protein S1